MGRLGGIHLAQSIEDSLYADLVPEPGDFRRRHNRQSANFAPQFLSGPPGSLGDGNPLVSFNVYDENYREHVRANQYQWRDTLKQLVGREPVVSDFPHSAITVKTVWWPVRSRGLTAFPVWDAEPTRPINGVPKLACWWTRVTSG